MWLTCYKTGFTCAVENSNLLTNSKASAVYPVLQINMLISKLKVCKACNSPVLLKRLWVLMVGFQLEFVSISQVINQRPVLISSGIGGKFTLKK